jgi:hypothetical protein
MTNLMVYVNRRLLGQQRDKLYREALRLVLAEDPNAPFPPVSEADGPMKRLRAIARTHVKKCEEGDMQAIKELANRLDGKATQVVEQHDGEGQPMRRIVCEIVHVHETREALVERDDGPLLIEHQEEKSPLTNGHQEPLTDGHNGHDR